MPRTGYKRLMANFLYVDYSNVWIEGMHVSAVSKGMAPDIWTAQEQKICDYSWKLNFGKVLEFAGGGDVSRASLYGSRPPPNDSLWGAAEKKGFEVTVFDRNSANKEKKIDTTIVLDVTTDSYERMKKGDEITLVAGDRDYVTLVQKLRSRGFGFDVVFWDHAARELKDAASKFISLDEYLEHLALK